MAKSFTIRKHVRENILKLKPYSSARDEYSGSASLFLDANENPHNAPFNRYPDPRQNELKELISRIKGIPKESIFLGNGSDEGIDLLFRVLCEPGSDNVVIVDPTYGMYGVCAQINDVEQRSVLLQSDFSLDPDRVLESVDERTRMIFLCSPNNPTSNSLERSAVLRIVKEAGCVVVVDEAYIDFSRDSGMLNQVNEHKNLVVLQTLSKAWGLAGIRLGMVFAHPELIGYLSAVKYPYNLNSLSLHVARDQLSAQPSGATWVAEILKERGRLARELTQLRFIEKVHPSDANFLLIQMADPAAVYRFLMERGIIVRDRSSVPLCEGCLRITVGTPEENQILLDAMSDCDQNLFNTSAQ